MVARTFFESIPGEPLDLPDYAPGAPETQPDGETVNDPPPSPNPKPEGNGPQPANGDTATSAKASQAPS